MFSFLFSSSFFPSYSSYFTFFLSFFLFLLSSGRVDWAVLPLTRLSALIYLTVGGALRLSVYIVMISKPTTQDSNDNLIAAMVIRVGVFIFVFPLFRPVWRESYLGYR